MCSSRTGSECRTRPARPSDPPTSRTSRLAASARAACQHTPAVHQEAYTCHATYTCREKHNAALAHSTAAPVSVSPLCRQSHGIVHACVHDECGGEGERLKKERRSVGGLEVARVDVPIQLPHSGTNRHRPQSLSLPGSRLPDDRYTTFLIVPATLSNASAAAAAVAAVCHSDGAGGKSSCPGFASGKRDVRGNDLHRSSC